jgi:segregation and condensation protein B
MSHEQAPEQTELGLEPSADRAAPIAEVTADQLLGEAPAREDGGADSELKAVIEGIVYVSDEPVTARQIAAGLGQPVEKVQAILEELVADYSAPTRGLMIREVAQGYKMSTKPEHHEAIRAFVKSLTPPLKLSMAALETLAVIAYKQPITAPEIMEIRGVQGAGVLKTLLERKLITAAGRKNVVGRPILYRTTKEFLVQFGLKDLSELPSLKEFEELARLAFGSSEPEAAAAPKAPQTETEPPATAPDNDVRTATEG